MSHMARSLHQVGIGSTIRQLRNPDLDTWEFDIVRSFRIVFAINFVFSSSLGIIFFFFSASLRT